MKTASGRTVTGHAEKADRLPIRPASGRQAGTGLFARTNHWKDTRGAGSSSRRVTSKEHRHQPDNSPRRGYDTLTVLSPYVGIVNPWLRV
jgi:hypothetical protein